MSNQVTQIKVEKVDKPELQKHDSKTLDLAFAMDCTGSMGSYITSAQDNIRRIVEEIVASENCDVRLALVEYRDHPPQDSSFVTRTHDFTGSPKTMKGWLDNCHASGGGDKPEAVADALHDVLKLSWRDEATKICVCISDAPPHGLGCSSDGFPNGCPNGIDPMKVTHQLAEKGITIYMVGCEPSITPYKDFFMAVAFITGGQYVPLSKSQLLSKVIIGGAQEEMSLEQLMAEVETEVEAEVNAGREINEDVMSTMMHNRWQLRGEQVQQLHRNNAELLTAKSSPMAEKFSKRSTLCDVRKDFAAASGRSSSGAGWGSSGAGWGSSGAGWGSSGAGWGSSGAGWGSSGAGWGSSGAGWGSGLVSAVGGWLGFGAGGGDPPRSAAPPPAPMMAGPEATEDYSTVTADISHAQSSRMVQKAMARKGKKS